MNYHLKLITQLLHELEKNNLLHSINKNGSAFFDEPVRFSYSAIINNPSKYIKTNKYIIPNKEKISGGGVSFFSKYLALLKCLSECIERLSMFCYKKNSLLITSYNNINKRALEQAIFNGDKSLRKMKFGWMNGFDFMRNINCLIPAQLIYLNYHRVKREIRLTIPISTGAAGGFTHEETLLRGIYETVERDAFMTMYLNKIKAKRIDVYKISDYKIKYIINYCNRYNLLPYLFDITNDLKIPTFLTILVNPTGIGPSVTIGLKSDMNVSSAIIGSLEESFLSRSWLRFEITKTRSAKKNVKPNNIVSFIDRGLYWFPLKMLKHLDFLLSQRQSYYKIIPFHKSPKEELSFIKKIFSDKNFRIFYADISLEMFKKNNFKVYKVILPDLQPLYLNETEKLIKLDRIKQVSGYFGYNNISINNIPHPFL